MQTSTKYFLYNPTTKEKKEGADDFYETCKISDNTPGLWEIHVTKQDKPNTRKKSHSPSPS